MSIKKLNKREEVADWYVTNVLHLHKNEGLAPVIDWFIVNLNENAFNALCKEYEKQMNNLEAEGFFK
jgi:hypothetical protein